MLTKTFDNSQYDQLQTCPFCGEQNLMVGEENCPHFVVAFQEGLWSPDLCPPVFCEGFKYRRRELEAQLRQIPGIICHMKPITTRHPRIDVYFCIEEGKATELQWRFKKQPIIGARCTFCGNGTAIRSDEGEFICAICGEASDFVEPASRMIQ